MNSRSLRRLGGDHATLHASLPPNYLFDPHAGPSEQLTRLDILLAGPDETPYAGGLYRLHLEVPADYPCSPPTAHFRTRIWHPNVDEKSGAVCVDTLKRDWDAGLTLRDVLVIISCLLIQPNPDSALNAEAGALLKNDWEAFCTRAHLMTGVHAPVPKELKQHVDEAKARGEDKAKSVDARQKGAPATDEARAKGAKRRRRANQPRSKMAEKQSPHMGENDNVASRRGSGDWISPPVGAPSTPQAPDIPSTPLADIQTPGSNRAPVRITRATAASIARQAPYLTPRNLTPAPRSPDEPPSSTSSNSSLNNRLKILSFHQPPESRLSPEAFKKERYETRHFRAAGYCWKRYNRGAFGPRTGLKRL